MDKLFFFKTLYLCIILFSVNVSWALEKCPDSPTKDAKVYSNWSNCLGSILTPKGSYSGGVLGGIAQGFGIRIYTKSSAYIKYEGFWKGDMFHGQGTLTYSNGDTYEGDWLRGQKSGKGFLKYANGESYNGSWINNLSNGKGEYISLNGDKFVGDWLDGEKNGSGSYYSGEDGVFYKGQWRNNMKSGHGMEFYPNGEKFTGNFVAGEKSNQGIYTFPNGTSYNGEWKDGEYNGFGKLKLLGGGLYHGEFLNGKFEGHGTFYYKNGNVYFGQFLDNQIHGAGTITYPNGDKYFAYWKSGKYDGSGILTQSDGKTLSGFWVGDIFQEDKIVFEVEKESNTDIALFSSGSGFAVSSQGFIVTNHHVIEGCKEVYIHSNHNAVLARIIAFDAVNDLALLKGNFSPNESFALESSSPILLQDIYVAGYPFGKDISSSVKVTKGIISSLTGFNNNSSTIQIDAALQPGNSGGPIIDENGNVIGVAVAKMDSDYSLKQYGVVPERTNFGIKSSVVVNMLENNAVKISPLKKVKLDKLDLAQIISKGTFYISCWLAADQIKLIKNKFN
jgi:hypothetical protein